MHALVRLALCAGAASILAMVRPPMALGQSAWQPISSGGLEIQIAGPRTVWLREPFVATVTIVNRGSAAVANGGMKLRLSDGLRLSASPTGPRGPFNLPPARSLQVELRLEATKSGSQGIEASAEADGGVKGRAEHRLLAQRAELQVELSGPDRKFIGQHAEYRLTVSNPGDVPLERVLAFFEFPRYCEVDGAETGGVHDPEQSLVYWPLGPLPPAGRQTLRVSLRAREPGSPQLRASARNDGKIDAESFSTTTFFGHATASLEIRTLPEPVFAGQQGTIELHIRNRSGAATGAIELAVKLGSGLRAHAAGAWTAAEGKWTYKSRSLEPGEERQINLAVTGQRAGDHVIEASLSSPNLAGPIRHAQTLRVYETSLPDKK